MNTLYLAHHGIKGQKWGVRRYQNPDGTLTSAGKKRDAKRAQRELNRIDQKIAENKYERDLANEAAKYYSKKINKVKRKRQAISDKYANYEDILNGKNQTYSAFDSIKAKYYRAELNRLEKKGKKLVEQKVKNVKSVKAHTEDIERGQKEIIEVLDSIKDKPYTVSWKPTWRNVRTSYNGNGYTYYYRKGTAFEVKPK